MGWLWVNEGSSVKCTARPARPRLENGLLDSTWNSQHLWWPIVILRVSCCQSYHLCDWSKQWLEQSIVGKLNKINKINIMVGARYICTVLDQIWFGGRILHFRDIIGTPTSLHLQNCCKQISLHFRKHICSAGIFEFPRNLLMESIETPRKFPRSVILDWNPLSKEIASYCTWIGEMIDRSQYCNKHGFLCTCGLGSMFVVE